MIIAIVLTNVLAGLETTRHAKAVGGLPGTPQFGYGARLDIKGQRLSQAIELAAEMNFSWLLVEFDWFSFWADSTTPPILNLFDAIATIAREKDISLVISIVNPPPWAMTSQGPDPESTSRLVILLASRYPGTVLAFELFPPANTTAGWSASPNPQRYADLLQFVYVDLNSTALDIQLITTLSPLLPGDSSKNLPDDSFLVGLYESGWQSGTSILGVYYPLITGKTLSPPSGSVYPVLRHYEKLREILIEHHDEHRLMWITGFSWPNEFIDEENPIQDQALWLFQAYRLLTAQLYIGAAFVEQLNPNPTTGLSSLLLQDGTLHPVCSLLSQLTDPTNMVVLTPLDKESRLSNLIKVISK